MADDGYARVSRPRHDAVTRRDPKVPTFDGVAVAPMRRRNGCIQSATASPAIAHGPVGLRLSLFGDFQRVVDHDSEVSHGAFKFRMAEQDLNGPKIPAPVMDQSARFAASNEWRKPPDHCPIDPAQVRTIQKY